MARLGLGLDQFWPLGYARVITDLEYTSTDIDDGEEDEAYSYQLLTTGGVAPVTHALASGALPAGLTVSSTGLVSGTPTESGTFTPKFRATDATLQTDDLAVSFDIAAGTDPTAVSIWNKLTEIFEFDEATGATSVVGLKSGLTLTKTNTGYSTVAAPWGGNVLHVDGGSRSLTGGPNATYGLPGADAAFTIFMCIRFDAVPGTTSYPGSIWSPTREYLITVDASGTASLAMGTGPDVVITTGNTLASATWGFFYVRRVSATDAVDVRLNQGTAATGSLASCTTGTDDFSIGPITACALAGYGIVIGDSLTDAEITWLYNSGSFRSPADIKTLSGN